MRNLLAFLLLFCCGSAFSLGIKETRVLSRVKNLEIEQVDFSSLAPGTYVGSVAYLNVMVKARVEVAAGRVTEITLLEVEDTPYYRKAEAVLTAVVSGQTLEVDAVSGATASSRALLKAVENSFTGEHTEVSLE